MKPVAPPKNVDGRIAPARATHPGSLRQEAYEAIKHQIITCVLKPGEYINELQLSAVLAIGRTPVHQALERLTLEGMVDIIPHKGAIVRPFRLNEVLQIAEARTVNEIHCASLAAERASNISIAALEDVLAQMRHWASLRNLEKLVLLDRAFHRELASASQNNVLAELLRGLHERSLRFWFVSHGAPDQHDRVGRQHEAILATVRKRDPKAAEAAMRAHMESLRQSIAALL
jgi:GntR family transcriptional regulator, rspAB operon transcriptional repressor